jgi:hypothetical protein
VTRAIRATGVVRVIQMARAGGAIRVFRKIRVILVVKVVRVVWMARVPRAIRRFRKIRVMPR